jgi:hypothetical protein
MEGMDPNVEALGWKIINMQINSDGKDVLLLTHEDGRSVAMFRHDVVDLARRRATVEQIIARNKGANLADPWPALR